MIGLPLNVRVGTDINALAQALVDAVQGTRFHLHLALLARFGVLGVLGGDTRLQAR